MMVTPDHWRLISTPDRSGAYNMALDHAILEQVGAGNSPPTLRFYSWQPACLSLGQAQPGALWGLAKTHLQHLASAAAINLTRHLAWLAGPSRSHTRCSAFAALAA
jgi:hypothetical protein